MLAMVCVRTGVDTLCAVDLNVLSVQTLRPCSDVYTMADTNHFLELIWGPVQTSVSVCARDCIRTQNANAHEASRFGNSYISAGAHKLTHTPVSRMYVCVYACVSG